MDQPTAATGPGAEAAQQIDYITGTGIEGAGAGGWLRCAVAAQVDRNYLIGS